MNIVITGAGNGIGFETAKILSSNHKVLALSRNLDALKKLKSESENIEILKFDICESSHWHPTLNYIKENFSNVDVLINNAGLLVKKQFVDLTEKDIKQTFETNLFGIIKFIQVLQPFLKRTEGAHIVNIGSMGGFQGSAKFPALSVYSSSKAALACLSECLAEEFKDEKISVNCLALGSAQTNMLSRAFPGYKAPLSAMKMAEFIADFSINGRKYFNGKVLPVSITTP